MRWSYSYRICLIFESKYRRKNIYIGSDHSDYIVKDLTFWPDICKGHSIIIALRVTYKNNHWRIDLSTPIFWLWLLLFRWGMTLKRVVASFWYDPKGSKLNIIRAVISNILDSSNHFQNLLIPLHLFIKLIFLSCCYVCIVVCVSVSCDSQHYYFYS